MHINYNLNKKTPIIFAGFWGFGDPPIAIETPAGRAEYEQDQRAFTTRGDPLRARLLALCERLLTNQPSSAQPAHPLLSLSPP